MDDGGNERRYVCGEVGVEVDVVRSRAFCVWEGLGLQMFGTGGLSPVGRDVEIGVLWIRSRCHP